MNIGQDGVYADIDFIYLKLNGLMRFNEAKRRGDLEIMRNIMWSNLAPYDKNKKKPEDVMKFNWEKKRKK